MIMLLGFLVGVVLAILSFLWAIKWWIIGFIVLMMLIEG